jgi:hypothetical protein
MSLKFRPASGTGVLHLLAGQFLEKEVIFWGIT